MSDYAVTRTEITELDPLCHGIVTRGGWEDACNKPATTVVFDLASGGVWPACTWHAHRYGGALTLAEIRTALTGGYVWIKRGEEP